MYSLGWTLLEASGGQLDEESDKLTNLIHYLTAQSPEDRPNVQEVIDICNGALQNESSERICRELFDRTERYANQEAVIATQEKDISPNKEENPETKRIGLLRNFDRQAVVKPNVGIKSCLKNQNGKKSADKKKSSVSFSEGNRLVNLSISYHCPIEYTKNKIKGDNYCQKPNFNNANQIDVIERRVNFPKVPEPQDKDVHYARNPQKFPLFLNNSSRAHSKDLDFQSDFKESGVEQKSIETFQDGTFANSVSSQYSRLRDTKMNRYGKLSESGCTNSDTSLEEEFSRDVDCSDCCESKLTIKNPDMDIQSQNSGLKKWTTLDNKEPQNECGQAWTDKRRIAKFSDISTRQTPDSGIIDANEELNSSLRNSFFEEEMDGESSSERSSVELVPLGHANRSVLWNFTGDSIAPNQKNFGENGGNLVDLMLGSKNGESIFASEKISVTEDGMVSVPYDNAEGRSWNEQQNIPKQRSNTSSENGPFNREADAKTENPCRNSSANSDFTNNHYDGDDDDDASLLGEICNSRSFRGESAEQRLNRIKEVKATTLQDIIDVTGLYFDETELWALCREALLSLKKTKHIPSDISLDVLAIQPDGHLMFIDKWTSKLVNFDFAAQEIQENDRKAEKIAIYEIGNVLRLASGFKKSIPVANLGMSDTIMNLLGEMTFSEASHRPTADRILGLCEVHEKSALYASENICQSLYEECLQSLMECAAEDKNARLVVMSGKTAEISERKMSGPKKSEGNDENVVGTPDDRSAFTAVSSKWSDMPRGKKSVDLPAAFSSPVTHFKPIVLDDSRDRAQDVRAQKDRTLRDIKDAECREKRDDGKSLAKTTPALGNCPKNSKETFVSASRRVVEKLRQLEEVYTKQTSKRNLSESARKTAKSEKAESLTQEKISQQVPQQSQESLHMAVPKDQSLRKKEVEELAEVILNKLQEKQTNLSPLGLLDWNNLSINNSQPKPQVPLMMVPPQSMMTVPIVNAHYSPMSNSNGQCSDDGQVQFQTKTSPCLHCIYSSSPSVSHSETSSCLSDPNCCDSLEDDEELQTSFQALRHHPDFKRRSYKRCSLCSSHGRRAQGLVHKLRSRRTKKSKETKQPKCPCLRNKKWSSEMSLSTQTETWDGHCHPPVELSKFGSTSDLCEKDSKGFGLSMQPISPDKNLLKHRLERNQAEVKAKHTCLFCHLSDTHQMSRSCGSDAVILHQDLYHCECHAFTDHDHQDGSSSSSPNLTPEENPVSSHSKNQIPGMNDIFISTENQELFQNGNRHRQEKNPNSLRIKPFDDIHRRPCHSNSTLSAIHDDEGHSCFDHNCHRTSEGFCNQCPEIKSKTMSPSKDKGNSDPQELFLEALCNSQSISEGTIKQLHLILRIMRVIQRSTETDVLEKNPEENFVMGAGISSLKGMNFEKFKNTLATMYSNYEWSENCLHEIFDIINQTRTGQKNSLESDRENSSSSNKELVTNNNLGTEPSSMKSGISILAPEDVGSCEHKESLQNGKIPATLDAATKKPTEDDVVCNSKSLSWSFDKSEVPVPLPKPAAESQFQLVRKHDNSPREFFKQSEKQTYETKAKHVLTRGNAIEVDEVADLGDDNDEYSEFLEDEDTAGDAEITENKSKQEEFKETDENIEQDSFDDGENYFSSASSLEKEEFCEIQISLTDYKKYTHIDANNDGADYIAVTSVVLQEQSIGAASEIKECVISEKLPDKESLKKDKVLRHNSVMRKYRTYREAGSLLKVGVIPSSEVDFDQSDSQPSRRMSLENVNEEETPTRSSGVASSPISELSLDDDNNLFSESDNKTVSHRCVSPLSDVTSVHSFEYFPGPEKNILFPSLERDSRIVYHSADLLRFSDNMDVMTFLKGIDKSDFTSLTTRLKILQQQLLLETKEWQKMSRFYQNLQNKETWTKSNKSRITRVFNDLKECEETLNCLRLCRQHLELHIVSKCSLPHDLVHSLATCDGTEPLELIPQKDNPYLHYHMLSTTDDNTSVADTYVLNAGFPRALFANIYTQSALVEGILHQFFYCFRYFASPQQLFSFLTTTYVASKRCSQTEQARIVEERSLMLLTWWLKDYYSIDFQGNGKLCKMAQEFIQELPKDAKGVSDIKSIWGVYTSSQTSGHTHELMSTVPNESFVYTVSLCLTKKSPSSPVSASDWDLRTSLSCDNPSASKSFSLGRPSEQPSPTPTIHSRSSSSEGSSFSFNDHSAQILAEQLTLIEQELFQNVHPVQFLNSKFNGFNTSLTIPGWNNPRSIRNKQISATNLFVSDIVPRCLSVETQIRHAHQISHWVGAELISASSSREQVSLLTKFLQIADCCTRIQNYATGLAILDGLENALVRQLPTWKELSAKTLNIFTNLKTFKNSDCLSLTSEKSSVDRICHPAIPSILPYLLNIQQCEIGSFTLTNGMFKWTKMRHITRAIDPIRVFRQYKYPFKQISYLQNALKQLIEQTRHQDLNVLAREHSSYDDKISFPNHRKNNFRLAMKRIRDKLKTNK